jgi:hypothetical protein
VAGKTEAGRRAERAAFGAFRRDAVGRTAVGRTLAIQVAAGKIDPEFVVLAWCDASDIL